jgi:hypothetical protein
MTLSNNLTNMLLSDSMSFTIIGAVKNVLQTLWPETFSTLTFLSELDLHFDLHIFRKGVIVEIM